MSLAPIHDYEENVPRHLLVGDNDNDSGKPAAFGPQRHAHPPRAAPYPPHGATRMHRSIPASASSSFSFSSLDGALTPAPPPTSASSSHASTAPFPFRSLPYPSNGTYFKWDAQQRVGAWVADADADGADATILQLCGFAPVVPPSAAMTDLAEIDAVLKELETQRADTFGEDVMEGKTQTRTPLRAPVQEAEFGAIFDGIEAALSMGLVCAQSDARSVWDTESESESESGYSSSASSSSQSPATEPAISVDSRSQGVPESPMREFTASGWLLDDAGAGYTEPWGGREVAPLNGPRRGVSKMIEFDGPLGRIKVDGKDVVQEMQPEWWLQSNGLDWWSRILP